MDRIGEDVHPDRILNGSCVNMAVLLKGLHASFPNTACISQTGKPQQPANERPPFGLKSRKGQRSQGTVTLE